MFTFSPGWLILQQNGHLHMEMQAAHFIEGSDDRWEAGF